MTTKNKEEGLLGSIGTNASAQSAGSATAEEDVAPSGRPVVIAHDETDGRSRYEWTSKYPKSASCQIWLEASYVALILVASLAGIYATWRGYTAQILGCETCSTGALNRYAYFFFSGMLGNVLFGGKFLYHVVARGYWHQDRRLWRLLSPFLSASLAFIVAAVIESGMLGLAFRTGTYASCVALGFLSGYFADKALAKMTEIADVVFGTRDTKRGGKKNGDTGSSQDQS